MRKHNHYAILFLKLQNKRAVTMNIKKILFYTAAGPAALLFAGCSTMSETLSPADISVDELQRRKDMASDPEGRFGGA